MFKRISQHSFHQKGLIIAEDSQGNRKYIPTFSSTIIYPHEIVPPDHAVVQYFRTSTIEELSHLIKDLKYPTEEVLNMLRTGFQHVSSYKYNYIIDKSFYA